MEPQSTDFTSVDTWDGQSTVHTTYCERHFGERFKDTESAMLHMAICECDSSGHEPQDYCDKCDMDEWIEKLTSDSE